VVSVESKTGEIYMNIYRLQLRDMSVLCKKR